MNYYIFLVQRKMNNICGENAFHKAYCDVRESLKIYIPLWVNNNKIFVFSLKRMQN
jgi:hypothetical protein